MSEDIRPKKESGIVKRHALWLAALLVSAFILALILTRGVLAPLIPEHERIQRSYAHLKPQTPSVPEPDIEEPDAPFPDEFGEIPFQIPEDQNVDGSVAENPDASPELAKTPSGKSRTIPRGKGGDVVRVGPGSYIVRRGAIENALAKGGHGGARAVPVVENGKITGYKLTGVGRGLRRLGLKNGDVVQSINGRKMTSPDAAVGALSGLRRAKKARIVVRRGGRRLGFYYRIHDEPS